MIPEIKSLHSARGDVVFSDESVEWALSEPNPWSFVVLSEFALVFGMSMFAVKQ